MMHVTPHNCPMGIELISALSLSFDLSLQPFSVSSLHFLLAAFGKLASLGRYACRQLGARSAQRHRCVPAIVPIALTFLSAAAARVAV